MLNRESSAAWLALLTSASTLVCCALPALLVSLGAGVALASLVSAVPQLIWISMHKAWVFGAAGLMLAVAGYFQTRPAACPADARLARVCARSKAVGRVVYWISVAMFCTGAFFAFVLPRL
ncbi:hypothetical protein D3C71_24130 [compost metagenome]